MAKVVKQAVGVYTPTFHKTSIGRKPSTCKMNKQKRRSFKAYRGQGR